jgi:hypothetical protein
VDVPAAGNTALAFSHGPNPSREGGTLRFRLPAEQRVELAIYDLSGRRVARLANEVLSAGEHSVSWSRRDDRGRRVAPGVYRARLKSGDVVRTLSVVLVD